MTKFGELNLILTTTLDCNFRCPWCKRFELNKRFGLKEDYMKVDTVKEIFERNPLGKVVLTGGEPMLNLPLLDFVIKSGRETKVSTNGSILWPYQTVPKNFFFDISMNTTDFPKIYEDLLNKGCDPQKIRFFVYLDPIIENVEKIIDIIGPAPNRGYEVLPEMWIDEDPKYEAFIITSAKKLGEKHLLFHKDDGYIDYSTQNQAYRFKKKYDVHGNLVPSIWVQGCPAEEYEEMCKKYIYNENHFMQDGPRRLKFGIQGFGIPVEYYTALMYEEMKKIIES